MPAQIDKIYIQARPTKLFSRLIGYAFFEGRPLTTRGRWINPLVFGIFWLFKKLPALKKVTKPVFILGTGRSGTTVLGTILSMHKDVAYLNEPKAMWHSVIENDDLIGSYALDAAKYRLNKTDADSGVIKSIKKIYGGYLATIFSSRIVDKYPEMIFRTEFLQEIFPDAKFIFLVRNGWDTCASIEKWSSRLGIYQNDQEHDWWGLDKRKWYYLVNQLVPEHSDLAPFREEMLSWTKHSDMAAVEWIVTMREGIKLELELKINLLRVKFEDLSTAPKQSLENLSEFLELKKDNCFINFGVQTLKPVINHAEIELASCLVEPFNETMTNLGY